MTRLSTRRIVLAASLVAGALCVATNAAAEGPTFADHDVEETNVDRTLGFFINPVGVAFGVYGGEIDIALGDHLAIGAQGSIYRLGNTTAHAVGTGVQIFPARGTFHGLYLYPQLTFARATSDAPNVTDAVDVLGMGGTIGWQWTWDYGFSVRVGGGAMWFTGALETATDGARVQLALSGAKPVVDGSLGWVF